ncbi:seryl-tRNA synthetase [Thalassoporum mexicanum PCC 7367]|uniref:serine--tRNA ligase n=1 Tax=Thalassoporum mexicanum TaxID=3457544 RepID=UPI00029FBDC8|nr:serine--tRNA ligase [Pseudanabaena sp. PCC 7367]AFY70617.1 seryl-tRNA synthetase [Pseudanabaena sp. PCC 7367]
MLDIKLLRSQPEQIQELLNRRGGNYDLNQILELDSQIRELGTKRSNLQAEGNEIGKQVGQLIQSLKQAGGDLAEVDALKEKGNQVKAAIAALEPTEKALRQQMEEMLLVLPNLPSETTPIGKSEADNVEVRRWGDEFKPNHEVLPHEQIGTKLGILNIERGVKVAQARFISLWGAGAALERALIQFMLNTHTAKSYVEVMPPFLVNSDSMTGTGQLPKFAEDAFKCAEDDLWLIPTAEVPVTNLYRDEILEAETLPIHHCAYTPCFRREAGSYGRDTSGIMRLHQFNKVELVKFVHPDRSADEHEALVNDAEAILQLLKLPYRVVELCSGDLGFSAQKCYDLEVWVPAANKYREISSCSNFGDFQARRANLRFKTKGKKGTEYLHTLNGSGLAVGRTMLAILENYQQADGRVLVPEVLQPIMGREYL